MATEVREFPTSKLENNTMHKQFFDMQTVPLSVQAWSRDKTNINPLATTIRHQWEIEKIVEVKIAENMPNILRHVNSVIYDILQSPKYAEFRGLSNPEMWQDARLLDSVIRDSFADIGFVKQVSYVDLGQTLQIVVIYEHDDFSTAFNMLADKAIDVEMSLSDKDVVPIILHASEAEQRHLAGTKIVFVRP